jgi:prepilin-type N-terminal cleavage/methylation domain-containing protein/prepilin-type processing-associated H-X9-DG protein
MVLRHRPRPWSRPASRAGFSLPELLVVIAVIAILISILLPTIRRVRAASARVVCAAHLADLGRAFQMYLSDSKGRVPQVNALPLRKPPLTGDPSVLDVFGPYVKGSKEIWRCPSDTPLNTDSTFPSSADSYFAAYGLSYEYNSWLNSLHGGGTFSDALSVASRPPHLVSQNKFRIFNDFSHFHGKPGETGNMNFLFADWHVGDIGGALTGKDMVPG